MVHASRSVESTIPHSPLPWQKGTISGDDAWVFDANGQWVADYGQESARAFADRDFALAAVNAYDDLLAALQEIQKGEGPFNRDPFTHAMNTIENMQGIALTAIAKATGAQP